MLVILGALAIVPAAAQAKVVVHTGNRCAYIDTHPSPPPICGIKGPEVLYGYDDQNIYGGTIDMYGFKVSKRVRFGIPIHMPHVTDGDAYLMKRPKDGSGLGSTVGKSIDPRSLCIGPRDACRTESFDLSPGSYSLVAQATAGGPHYVKSYSVTITATPSGDVSPYVFGLFLAPSESCPKRLLDGMMRGTWTGCA